MARLLINPDDSIALAGLQRLIGFASASTLEVVESEAEQTQLSFWRIVDKESKGTIPSKQPEYNSLIEFAKKIVEIRKSIEVGKSIAPIISKILEFLAPYLKKSYANRWEEIENDYGILRSIAGPFVSINDFLNSVALEQFEEDEIPEEKTSYFLPSIVQRALSGTLYLLLGLLSFGFH